MAMRFVWSRYLIFLWNSAVVHTLNKQARFALFHILSEAGISAGVRRIEALTSTKAFEWYQERSETLAQVTQQLRVQVSDVPQQVEKLIDDKRKLEKELAELRKEIAQLQAGDLMDTVQEANGLKFIAAEFNGDMNAMREEADRLRNQLRERCSCIGIRHTGA